MNPTHEELGSLSLNHSQVPQQYAHSPRISKRFYSSGHLQIVLPCGGRPSRIRRSLCHDTMRSFKTMRVQQLRSSHPPRPWLPGRAFLGPTQSSSHPFPPPPHPHLPIPSILVYSRYSLDGTQPPRSLATARVGDVPPKHGSATVDNIVSIMLKESHTLAHNLYPPFRLVAQGRGGLHEPCSDIFALQHSLKALGLSATAIAACLPSALAFAKQSRKCGCRSSGSKNREDRPSLHDPLLSKAWPTSAQHSSRREQRMSVQHDVVTGLLPTKTATQSNSASITSLRPRGVPTSLSEPSKLPAVESLLACRRCNCHGELLRIPKTSFFN